MRETPSLLGHGGPQLGGAGGRVPERWLAHPLPANVHPTGYVSPIRDRCVDSTAEGPLLPALERLGEPARNAHRISASCLFPRTAHSVIRCDC